MDRESNKMDWMNKGMIDGIVTDLIVAYDAARRIRQRALDPQTKRDASHIETQVQVSLDALVPFGTLAKNYWDDARSRGLGPC